MDPLCTLLTDLRPTLLRAARARLRNPHWAEDAVSETVLAALRKPPPFEDPARVRAWLLGVLQHKAVDQLRQHLGEDGALAALDSVKDEVGAVGDPRPWADPERRAVDQQFMAALHGQLARLPRAQARAFVMLECQGSDKAEICDELAVSMGNLWVMLHRARQRLRQGLAPHFV